VVKDGTKSCESHNEQQGRWQLVVLRFFPFSIALISSVGHASVMASEMHRNPSGAF
jgi:hypothetical protein